MEALSILDSVSALLGAGRESWSLSAVEKAAPGNCFLPTFSFILKQVSAAYDKQESSSAPFSLVQYFPPDLSTTSIMSAFRKAEFCSPRMTALSYTEERIS